MTLSVHAAKVRLNLIELEFVLIASEARESPVKLQAFVDHRIKFLKACEDLYQAMWMEIADTGVQLLRDTPDGKKVNGVKKD
jgi:hypothetical protein